MIVAPPDIVLLGANPWDSQPDDIMIDLLKLCSYILWPQDRDEKIRNQFMARIAYEWAEALNKQEEYFNTEERSGGAWKRLKAIKLDRISVKLRALRKTLLEPAGGIRAIAEISDKEMSVKIGQQIKKARTAATVVEFILMHHAYLNNYNRGASVYKCAHMIEEDWRSERIIYNSPVEVRKCWSEFKPVVCFCFADMMLDGPFLKIVMPNKDSFDSVDECWWIQDFHDAFFGLSYYAEKVLTNFKPSGATDNLLNKSEIHSVECVSDVLEICPILKPFSTSDIEELGRYKALRP